MNKLFNRLIKNKIVSNFAYLAGLQVFNYILPLFTIPYLIRVLQPELYGLTVYAQSLMLLFVVFIDYGFNITATQKVTQNISNKENISQILSSVLSTKIVLLVASYLILAIIILSVPKFGMHWQLYVFTAGILIGQVLFPTWLFQGLQEMKYMLYFNSLIKIIFTILIFVFIKSPKDFIYVNLFTSIGSIFVGLWSIYFILNKFKLTIHISDFATIKQELIEGWKVFASNISIQTYMVANLIILGFIADDKTVGNFSIAEKVMMLLRLFLAIFSQVLYPHVCKLSESPNDMKRFYISRVYPSLVVLFCLCGILYILANPIILFITGSGILQKDFEEIVLLLQLLSFVPFIVGLNIPSVLTVLAYNKKDIFLKVNLTGVIINISLNFLLTPDFKAIGSAISIILTELFVTIAFIIYSSKYINRLILNQP